MRSTIGHGNRGKALETAIEQANAQYAGLNIAQVQKIATPMKAVPDRKTGATRHFRERSTVDYLGVWQGRAIAFDAKENREKYFPLKNVHGHQVSFLDGWDLRGGVAFLLIYQEQDQAVYLLPYAELCVRWAAWANGGRASIPADELRELPRVKPGRGCVFDYLSALDGWLKRDGGDGP